MRREESAQLLAIPKCQTALVGVAIDDRGIAAHDYLRASGCRLVLAEYQPESFELTIDGHTRHADDFAELLSPFLGASLILEATTLGIPEILLTSRAIRDTAGLSVRLLYVEPLRYSNPRRTHVLHKRDFELSSKFPGFRPIPGHVLNLNDPRRTKGVFFLGFEDRRLDRAFEDHQMIDPRNCGLVFGVPGFRPGWEMNSFARNVRVIRDKGLRPELFFCAAENPAAAHFVLTQVKDSLQEKERMFVAPLGTKPNGIGAVLFCAEHPEVGVLYDHPHRKQGRSEALGRWHYFEARY